MTYRLDIPELRRLPVDQPAPCRLCGDPSWLTDPDGPVHACCLPLGRQHHRRPSLHLLPSSESRKAAIVTKRISWGSTNHTTLPWRVGRKVGRTIYDTSGPDGDGRLIGVMDTPELAAMVVQAVNAQHHQEADPA